MSRKGNASLVAVGLIITGLHGFGVVQDRPITVEDCVRTRRVVRQEVQLSPDGTHVAYLVKAPDVVKNRNSYRLYVRDTRQLEHRENGHLMLDADRISGIHWLEVLKKSRCWLSARHGRHKNRAVITSLTWST